MADEEDIVTDLVLTEALRKHFDNARKKSDSKLPQGKYEFHGQVVLQVDSSVTQRAGGLATPTVSLPLKAILAIALQKAGIQRENISKIIYESAMEARSLQDDVSGVLEELVNSGMKQAEKAVNELLADLPKIPRNGAVMVDAAVEIVKIIPTKQVSVNA